MGLAVTSDSTLPEYKTFGRDQRINYSPETSDLMRIWIVYVGQGDGILIQLPGIYNYDSNPDDNLDEKSERIDIMIDGGSSYSRNKTRMLEFLQSIYPQSSIIIEEESSGCTKILSFSHDLSNSVFPCQRPNSFLIYSHKLKWNIIKSFSGVFLSDCLSSSDINDRSLSTASSTVLGHSFLGLGIFFDVLVGNDLQSPLFDLH